jgi:hypothetical protein
MRRAKRVFSAGQVNGWAFALRPRLYGSLGCIELKMLRSTCRKYKSGAPKSYPTPSRRLDRFSSVNAVALPAESACHAP